jgi:7-cyano-7-deazaguanine synthase
MKSIVLLSGGLDSTVALYWAKSQGEVLAAVTVHYNQRHWVEVAQAGHIARRAGVRHEIDQLGGRGVGLGSALGSSTGAISTAADAVVPCRNLALLTLAAGWMEKVGGDSLVVGFSRDDAAVFADCRPPFVRAASSAIGLSLGRRVRIHAPLIAKNKVETLQLAEDLGCFSELKLTWTCYTPDKVSERAGHVRACGTCPSCTLRSSAFTAYGKLDPAADREVRA